MSLLSAIPRGVVLAMQLALVSLVLLATVPIATGGVQIDNADPEVKFDDTTYTVKVDMTASISTNLYFDVTGFSAGVSLSAGDQCFELYRINDMTIPRKGTDIALSGTSHEMPLMTFVTMMVYGAFRDENVVLVLDIRGSTLSGMMSMSTSVSTVVADISDGSMTLTSDSLSASFTVPASELIEEIFASGSTITIDIGDPHTLTCTVTLGPGGVITVTMDVIPPATSLIEALETAIAGAVDGKVKVYYDGNEVEMTLEQVTAMISMLELMYRGL